jgi:predicted DNA-binding transcriptional regulator
LKVSERPKYFAGLSSKAKKRIRKEELRIEKLAAYYNSHQQTDGGITKRRFKESLRAWRGYEFSPEPEEKVVLGVEESVDADMKAAMIYFKNSRPYTVPGFENEFPNQKISIKELLADDGERNPLMWGVGEDEVRYFHFPANNMIWIEVSTVFPSNKNRSDN